MNIIMEFISVIFLIYHLFCIGVFGSVVIGYAIEDIKKDEKGINKVKCFIITIIILVVSPIVSPILLGAYLGKKIQKNL